MKKPTRQENKTTNQGSHYQTKSYLSIVLQRSFNNDIFQETTKGMFSGWSLISIVEQLTCKKLGFV